MSVHAQVGQYSNKKLGDISDQMNIYEKKKGVLSLNLAHVQIQARTLTSCVPRERSLTPSNFSIYPLDHHSITPIELWDKMIEKSTIF